jgi:hypothetical protein
MLKGLNHQNICSIVYVCLSEEEVDRPFVVTPIMNQGNLKNFLKKSRTPEGTGLEKVGIKRLRFALFIVLFISVSYLLDNFPSFTF